VRELLMRVTALDGRGTDGRGRVGRVETILDRLLWTMIGTLITSCGSLIGIVLLLITKTSHG
jgi:hypothetical protein